PEFLACDEAVAALDVSIQAQVLNLFMDLRDQFQLTYLFISHDLGVVRHLSDRVVVMYLGRIVEIAATEDLFAAPNHPYTQALRTEVPRIDRKRRAFVPIKGEIPSPLAPPPGCHFHPRCPYVMDKCRVNVPPLLEIAPNRKSACLLNPPGFRCHERRRAAPPRESRPPGGQRSGVSRKRGGCTPRSTRTPRS